MEVLGEGEGYMGLREEGKVGRDEVMLEDEYEEGSCITLSTAGERKDTWLCWEAG